LVVEEAIGDWHVGVLAVGQTGISNDWVLLATVLANGNESLAMVCWCHGLRTPITINDAVLQTGPWSRRVS